MLAAVKGIVQGNTVVIEDEDIRDYNGTEVIVTLLNSPQRKAKKALQTEELMNAVMKNSRSYEEIL